MSARELPGVVEPVSARAMPRRSEYMSFQGWSLDDDYVCTLLTRVRLSVVKHIDLADNRLTQATISFLAEAAAVQGLRSLESLRLAKNRLGPEGGCRLAKLLRDVRPPLLELDLADNALGDDACEQICDTLASSCQKLVGLSLAKNLLGGSHKAGSALGNLLGCSPHLQALDLHWNRICGAGAAALVQGLYDNANQINGQLWRVNLAWNRLGVRCDVSLRVPDCKCDLCLQCRKVVSTLASVFSDCKALFHLDVSYANFRPQDCEVLAEGLKKNHTLFGLHFDGNGAAIDDVGFLIPKATTEPRGPDGVQRSLNESVRGTPRRLMLDRLGAHAAKSRDLYLSHALVNPSLQSVATPDAFSAQDLETEKEWVGVQSRVQHASNFSGSDRFEDVRINERCCWICENWVEEPICYIPGWSGSETSADAVTSVYAYFSIDDFSKPSRLTRTTEKYFERHFASEPTFARRPTQAALASNEGEGGGENPKPPRKRKPFVDKKGHYVVFRGSRMLPPSSLSTHIIFQVNESLVTALHLRKTRLAMPQTVRLHSDGNSASIGVADLPTVAAPSDTTAEASEANTICVGVHAWTLFSEGLASTLCQMEDPRRRGGLLTVPRKLQYDRAAATHEAWKYETSVFKDYVRETDQLYVACFEYDYAASKLEKQVERSMKGPAAEATANYLKKNYKCLVAAFHGRAFHGFEQQRAGACLSLIGFTDLMSERAEAEEPFREQALASPSSSTGFKRSKSGVGSFKKSKSSGVLNAKFFTSWADTIFVGANAVARDNSVANEMEVLPQHGLARFQFLEAFAQLALQRFQRSGEHDTAVGAVKELVSRLNLGQDQLYLRSTLQKALFVEECCLVFRQCSKTLEEAFNIFSRRLPMRGRGGSKVMSFAAWLEFLKACVSSDFGLMPDDMGIAFALGKEIRVDEYSSFRHMELNYSEFLVAIGAAVRLSGNFSPNFLSDRLLDFVEEHVSRALRASGKPHAARLLEDAQTRKVMDLMGQVWEVADEDGSGLLSYTEFRAALVHKNIEKSFNDAGFLTHDLKLLFVTVDVDKSGEVTFDELSDGLVKMKKAMHGMERCVAFLRKTFEENDKDGSGSLSKKEALALLMNPVVQAKLGQMNVPVDDLNDVWNAIDAQDLDDVEGVTAEEMLAGLLSIRMENSASARAINFMRQVFKLADVKGDNSNTMSREEVEEHFTTERVTHKLESLKLSTPDWMGIFDVLDFNGDGQLTWEELSGGLRATWTAVQEGKVRAAFDDPQAGEQSTGEEAS